MADAPRLFPKLADADWQRREQLIQRFEQAWRNGPRPAIEDFLPAGDADRPAILVELVHADLECRLKAGEAIRVETYLDRFPELTLQRSVVLGLIAAEYDLRRRAEPTLRRQHYLERFPQFSADLAAHWLASEVVAPVELPTTLEPVPPLTTEDLPRFSGYEVLALVAKGGMGAVYRARQPRLDRLVAIKTMTPETEQQPSFAERFAREARALAQLGHPHIIAVHDFGEANGSYYLVMEFADGPNLRQLLRGGPLDLPTALRITRAVCDALHYAHEEGIVHRDIKPENILTDQKGRVKIVDFGLAKLLHLPDRASAVHLTGPYQVMGTLHYMAPEQLHNPLQVDQRADIYALGVVLYEMLTGELPLGLFVPPSNVHGDARLDALILKMLEKDQRRRFQHIGEIQSALDVIASASRASQVVPALEVPPTSADLSEATSGLSVGFGLRAGALFLPAWLLTGVLANFGLMGLTTAALVLAILAYGASEWSLRHLPALRDELHRHGRAQGRVNLVLALILFLGGFASLCGALYTWWDQSVVDLAAFIGAYRISEQRFLHQLKAFRDAPPQLVELTYVTGSFALDRQFAMLLGICGCLLVACSLFALLETRRYRGGWGYHWQPVLVLSLAILVSLPLAYLASGMTQLRLVQTEDGNRSITADFRTVKVPSRQRSCDASPDQVTSALKQWSQEHGYDLQRRGLWNIDTIPEGKTVGQLGIFEARSRSVFEHWQLTWGGPRQRTPALKIQFLCSLEPAETVVKIDPGVVYEGSAEADAWTPYLDSLEAALENCGAPREKDR